MTANLMADSLDLFGPPRCAQCHGEPHFGPCPLPGDWQTPRTYEGKLDGPRLTRLLDLVREALSDGEWWTLRQLQARCGHSEAGISARIRELRWRSAGSHIIERKRIGDMKQGWWAYRMVR